SMQRTGLWAAARERAAAIVRRAGPTDEVALFAFDRAARPVVSFEEWNRTAASDRPALVSSRLGALTPARNGTHLGNALITAAEALAETEGKSGGENAPRRDGPREIVLVSDLQAGSRLDALQAYEWPKGVRLAVEAIKPATQTNAGLQLVADNADASRADVVVRVRVTNSTEAKREQFQVGWASATQAVGAPVDVYVPPGQSRVVALPLPHSAGTAADRIVLHGDDDPFDNTVFVIPP